MRSPAGSRQSRHRTRLRAAWVLALWAGSLLVLVLAILPRAVWAEGPREEVNAAIDRLSAARSFVATFSGQGGRLEHELEYAAPGRYRIRGGGAVQTIVGDVLMLERDGERQQGRLPQDTLARWRDPANLVEQAGAMDVTALDDEIVGGQPARRYRIALPAPAPTVLMWIGTDGYPLQLALAGAPGREEPLVIRYARFNAPDIRIDLPR